MDGVRKTAKTETKRPRTYSEVLAERKKASEVKKVKDEPLYKKKEDSVNFSVKDGLFTSIKNGLTENFVMPFAIALSATSGMLAAISSVPHLVGSFMQLFSQASLKFFKTRSKIIFWSAFIQALIWIPLLLIPLIAKGNTRLSCLLLLIFITLEVTVGTFQGPIYNSILGDIIDEDRRGEFFGKRNRVVNFVGFVSTMIAGLLLGVFKKLDTGGTAHYVFFGFGILFLLAFISRLISAYYKARIYDPPYTPPKKNVTLMNFLKNMTNSNYGIFVLYVFMFRLVVYISAPFFALYLLRDMQLSYMSYTIIIGASIIASFMTMGIWGRIIDKRGSKFVLKIAGFLIPLSPLMMILAIYIPDVKMRFIYLLLEEAFSGIVWAAFNLSTSSFLFDATSKEERVSYISYYNFLSGIAVFLGATLGGVLIKVYPVWVVSAIPFIFLTTGILRFVVTSMFIRQVHEARMVEIDFPGRGFFHRVITITPHTHQHVEVMHVYNNPSGAIFHHLFSSKPKNKEEKKMTKDEEKKYYEQKAFEFYKENAMKTMNQKEKQYTPEDDVLKQRRKK